MMGPYTPTWLAEEEDKPVFHLRCGTVFERDSFEGELDGRWRAGVVLQFMIQEAAVSGIEALMPGDEGKALVELVRAEAGGEALSPAEQAKVRRAIQVLEEHWPDYRLLVEQEARRNRLLPTLAFAQWCDGWENLKDEEGELVPYERSLIGKIPDDLLRRVPFTILRAVGLEAYSRQYAGTFRKN